MRISNKNQTIKIVGVNDEIDFSIYQVGQIVGVDFGDEIIYYKVNKAIDPDDNNVGQCIINEILVPLCVDGLLDKYEIYAKGTDLSSYNILFLRRPIYPDNSLVKVYVNDVEWSDWQFDYHYQNRAGYVAHIKFGTRPANDDVIKVVYKEHLLLPTPNDIRLVRFENGSEVKARNAMITKTINHPTYGFMYLKDATKNNGDFTDWTCTYSTTGIIADEVQIEKKFFNAFWVGNFRKNDALPDDYVIEVWGRDMKTNFDNDGNSGGKSKSRRSSFVPIHKTTNNLVYLFRDLQARSNYFRIRLRKETDDGIVFSPFSEVGVSVRRFPLFTTNSSLSSDDYKGTYYMSLVG